MKKRIRFFLIIKFILILVVFSCISWLLLNLNNNKNDLSKKNIVNNNSIVNEKESDKNNSSLNNDVVINTNSTSTIRIINKYDPSMFKNKKSILLMWGTWCNNCQEELPELVKIVKYYKNTDISVFLISHDFNKETLISFLENTKLDFSTQILLDLKRVVRSGIDINENSIPVAYILNEDLMILKKISGGVTFEEIQSLTNDLFNK